MKSVPARFLLNVVARECCKSLNQPYTEVRPMCASVFAPRPKYVVVKEFFVKRLFRLRPSISLVLAFVLCVPFAAFSGDNKEKDPDNIGDRNVSGKVNFYSLEKEIALGKQLAQQVERQSKVVNDPVVSEYVNR